MAGFGPMGDAGNEQFGDADDELGVEKVCYLERSEQKQSRNTPNYSALYAYLRLILHMDDN